MNRLYHPAYWLLLAKRRFILIVILLMLVTLSACDGGIFGTGDGNDGNTTIIAPDMSTDGNGAAPTEPPSSVDGSVTDGSTTDGSATDGATTDGQGDPSESPGNGSNTGFSNSTNETNRSDALVRLVNAHSALQDSLVVTVNTNRDNPLVPLPGLDYIQGSSNYLALSPEQSTSLELLLAENFRAGLFDLSTDLQPLELATGSITTIIVRDTPSSLPETFDVLPLVTRSTTGNANASLRVVHTAGSIPGESEINVVLFRSGDTAGQAIAGFVPLNYTRQPDSDYVETTPGLYTVQFISGDVDIGISSTINPINLAADQTVTLVIRDTQTGRPGMDVDVLLLDDSTLP